MFFKKWMAVVLGLVIGLSAVGCATPDDGDTLLEEKLDDKRTQLYVFNYGGGFGEEWLRAAKDRYEKLHASDSYEEGKQGVQIMIESKKKSLTTADIKSSVNEVFFTEGVNYYALVNDNAALDLTEALKKPLSDLDANDERSILDKFYDDQKSYFGVERNGETHYYAVPHYAGYWGLIYNVDLFDSEGWYFAADQSLYAESGDLEDRFVSRMNAAKSFGPDGQTGVVNGVDYSADDGLPATYEEFFALCEYIVLSGGLPLVWTGANYRDYLNTFMYTLAVDYEGKEKMMRNYTFEGTADYLGTVQNGKFAYDSDPTRIEPANAYELYRSDSRYYALQFLEQLCKDDAAHNRYHNDSVFNNGYSHMNAQEDFLNAGVDGKTPKTAMLIDGVWWQMEAVATFNDMENFYGEQYAAANRRFAYMPLPKANATKAAETAASTVKQTLYDAQRAASFVRANIADYKKDLAVDFLRFVNTQQSLVEYTQITGTTKALDYTLDADERAGLSHFARSVIDLHSKSEVVYPYSSHPFYLNNSSSFRPGEMFRSSVGAKEYQWAAECFRDYGMSADTYFSGMGTYYRVKWPTMQGI